MSADSSFINPQIEHYLVSTRCEGGRSGLQVMVAFVKKQRSLRSTYSFDGIEVQTLHADSLMLPLVRTRGAQSKA